jgi:hypothetical protein
MPSLDAGEGGTFAERLDLLFRAFPDPKTGKPYSARKVAGELSRQGCAMSHTQLNNLRQGKAPDPRRSVMEALARFFGQPTTYFVDISSDVPSSEQSGAQPELTLALSDPAIKQVAMRLVDARLSPEGTAAVVAMIEQVRGLEAAARLRGRNDRSPDG